MCEFFKLFKLEFDRISYLLNFIQLEMKKFLASITIFASL